MPARSRRDDRPRNTSGIPVPGGSQSRCRLRRLGSQAQLASLGKGYDLNEQIGQVRASVHVRRYLRDSRASKRILHVDRSAARSAPAQPQCSRKPGHTPSSSRSISSSEGLPSTRFASGSNLATRPTAVGRDGGAIVALRSRTTARISRMASSPTYKHVGLHRTRDDEGPRRIGGCREKARPRRTTRHLDRGLQATFPPARRSSRDGARGRCRSISSRRDAYARARNYHLPNDKGGNRRSTLGPVRGISRWT